MRSIATCLAIVLSLIAAQRSLADDLVTLDGQKLNGQITAIDAAGKITGEGLTADIELDGLRRIDRQTENGVKGAVALELIGGGRVHGDSITVENEKFHVAWSVADKLVLPIDVVRAVRFKPGTSDDAFDAALAKPSADNDRLFVDADGKLTILTGLIESLTAEAVTFQYEGQQQTLPTAKLFGIVVAQVGKAGKNSTGVIAELAEGSRVVGAVKSLAEGKLTLTVGPTDVVLPWSSVKSLAVRSSRLAYLSDMEPSEAEEYRLVTLPQGFQRDKNVNKKPLLLGEQSFERGIGVHAYSKLTFEIEGSYKLFNAVIGIDSSTDRKGDCVFVVLGDNQELLRERMTGASEPKTLKVDVAGVKQLTLVVEPGEDLDLADVANWADARVIK